MLQKLVEWKEQKDAWPKTLSKDSQERALAKWLSNQRSYMKSMEAGTDPKRLKGMTDERIQILDTRVPGWRGTWKAKKRFSSKIPWEDSLQKAVEWREHHPDRWPTLTARDEEEEKVYFWLVEQRRYLRNMLKGNTTKLGGMTPARAARLDMELGDAWFRGNKGPESKAKKKTSKKKKKKTTTVLDIEGDEKEEVEVEEEEEEEEEKEEEEQEEQEGRRRKRKGT